MVFPFLIPLFSALAAAGGAAGGIAGAVKAGNDAKRSQEEAYSAQLNREQLEKQVRGGMRPM